ncbi:hypothetical protein Tc00.1047053511807.125 [Trypanosoma cruzi]|uniref:Uncharacterized protein n=1 Tax=Trypanosoma cruzi (strain CL Brener) TaxID=353153 RepID=Q4E1D2_TRYCC|nr:hypothetical protein Tc00.1047053511807.125 [Trypanosoma cruzi]EAN98567.1 hypothetical protein Tc00.1047053511807.125 [Trypanosoma cruzi]|eukprot:XP_820418.1 hypothetical protein [Trypanosoma cruzi strain CL Brener]
MYSFSFAFLFLRVRNGVRRRTVNTGKKKIRGGMECACACVCVRGAPPARDGGGRKKKENKRFCRRWPPSTNAPKIHGFFFFFGFLRLLVFLLRLSFASLTVCKVLGIWGFFFFSLSFVFLRSTTCLFVLLHEPHIKLIIYLFIYLFIYLLLLFFCMCVCRSLFLVVHFLLLFPFSLIPVERQLFLFPRSYIRTDIHKYIHACMRVRWDMRVRICRCMAWGGKANIKSIY